MHKLGSFIQSSDTHTVRSMSAAGETLGTKRPSSGAHLHSPATGMTLRWILPTDIKNRPVKINSKTWEVFCQETFVVPSKTSKTIKLPIGIELSDGVVIASLAQSIKMQKCYLLNEFTMESTNNLLITLHNNAEKDVVVTEGTKMCHVSYLI